MKSANQSTLSDAGRALLSLMEERDLSRQDVAGLLSVSTHTVDAWLAPMTSGRYRQVSRSSLELLEIKSKK